MMADINGESVESCEYELKTFDRIGRNNCVWALNYIKELEELNGVLSKAVDDLCEERDAYHDQLETAEDKCRALQNLVTEFEHERRKDIYFGDYIWEWGFGTPRKVRDDK